jgi:membrane-bound lytic murein transglycosylase MltF
MKRSILRLLLWLPLIAVPFQAAAQTPATTEKPDREELTITAEEAMQPWSGDLDQMIERRTIRVLTTFSKTFYFIDRGTQRGATYDAFRLFEEDLNKKLAKQKKLKQKHLKVSVMFIPVGRDELLPALAAGKGDITAANLTVTENRRQLVDFSKPVYADVSEVVISGPFSPSVYRVEDLAGQELFVRRSSSYFESLTALNERFAAEKKPAMILKEAPESLEDEDLIEMLNAGLIPLIVVDKHKALFWKQVFPKIKIHETVALRAGAEIAWAIRKQSPQLKAALDDFLAKNSATSAKGSQILTRYLKNAAYVKNAASQAERKKFLDLIQFFQKYGDRYDVDWLLMAAQGYQESRLNQNARSPVGAIGVMQVMPETGKDLDVGDITKTEPNIHAGVKYMRWMIDQYYGQEPMTQLDKALFAFASYNAGAGRISQLRKMAAKRGLDPNIWFHNVEYVAAEKIGAETVTYVSNFYKYYVAYSLIIDKMGKKKQSIEQLKEDQQ